MNTTEQKEQKEETEALEQTEIDTLSQEVDKKIVSQLQKFDEIRAQTEEKIEQNIVKSEKDPAVKAEYYILAATHTEMLPHFLSHYVDRQKRKLRTLHKIRNGFRLLAASFTISRSKILVLPLIEYLDLHYSISKQK